MKLHILFSVPKKLKATALSFLSDFTQEPLYEIEEETAFSIGGFFSKIPDNLPDFLSSYTLLKDFVDWQNQWESFSPSMQDGLFELDLADYGITRKIKLKPGPGFGDLSHPTTKLCLKFLPKFCKNQNVIDFGCGSGILSVAAYAFGAYQVFSLEIDQDAINHAKENLRLNEFKDHLVLEQMPKTPLEGHVICVINMTFGEQKIALRSLDAFPKNTEFLSSGILKSQKDAYIKWAKDLGIEFKLLAHEEKWALLYGTLIKQ